MRKGIEKSGFVQAILRKDSVILSQLGSEKVHPGLQIILPDHTVRFRYQPEISKEGCLVISAPATANVLIIFGDGIKVRFWEYPVVVKAGSRIAEIQTQLEQLEQAA